MPEEKDEKKNLKEKKTVEPKTDELKYGYIKPRELVEEMQSSFLDYAMSVIVQRALPDVRDGMKMRYCGW